jgi:hypothetical protein
LAVTDVHPASNSLGKTLAPIDEEIATNDWRDLPK